VHYNPIPVTPACATVLVDARHLVPGLLIRRHDQWHHIYSATHTDQHTRFIFDGPGPYTDRTRVDSPRGLWPVHVPDLNRLPTDTPALAALDAKLAHPRAWNPVCLSTDEHDLAARYSADFYQVRRPHDTRPPIDAETSYRRALVSSCFDVANHYAAQRRWAAGLAIVRAHAEHLGLVASAPC
jgi:hypothetical protein